MHGNNLEIEGVSTKCVANDVYAPEKKGNEKGKGLLLGTCYKPLICEINKLGMRI
jgi:hypothetical protein